MNHAQIIKLYKTPTEAKRATGYTLQTLRNWKRLNDKGHPIPPKTQLWLQHVTGGKLKADRK